MRALSWRGGFLTATALAPPWIVVLASDNDALQGLGTLVLASALAALLSSYVWGRLADRSSRMVLVLTGICGAVSMIFALAFAALGLTGTLWAMPLALFGLMVAHQGVRLGRSTYIVDMAAPGAPRDLYRDLQIPLSGVILLASGLFGALAALGGAETDIGAVHADGFGRRMDRLRIEGIGRWLTIWKRRRAASWPITRPTGAAPALFFLGGFMSDMSGTKAVWLEDWARSNGRAFLRFDYSGHGESSGAFTDGCIGDWAADAMAALTALTEGPQILVGSSMGGWIALLLARAMPARVHALVGIAAAPRFHRGQHVARPERRPTSRDHGQGPDHPAQRTMTRPIP